MLVLAFFLGVIGQSFVLQATFAMDGLDRSIFPSKNADFNPDSHLYPSNSDVHILGTSDTYVHQNPFMVGNTITSLLTGKHVNCVRGGCYCSPFGRADVVPEEFSFARLKFPLITNSILDVLRARGKLGPYCQVVALNMRLIVDVLATFRVRVQGFWYEAPQAFSRILDVRGIFVPQGDALGLSLRSRGEWIFPESEKEYFRSRKEFPELSPTSAAVNAIFNSVPITLEDGSRSFLIPALFGIIATFWICMRDARFLKAFNPPGSRCTVVHAMGIVRVMRHPWATAFELYSLVRQAAIAGAFAITDAFMLGIIDLIHKENMGAFRIFTGNDMSFTSHEFRSPVASMVSLDKLVNVHINRAPSRFGDEMILTTACVDQSVPSCRRGQPFGPLPEKVLRRAVRIILTFKTGARTPDIAFSAGSGSAWRNAILLMNRKTFIEYLDRLSGQIILHRNVTRQAITDNQVL